jgi:hypothetical protein
VSGPRNRRAFDPFLERGERFRRGGLITEPGQRLDPIAGEANEPRMPHRSQKALGLLERGASRIIVAETELEQSQRREALGLYPTILPGAGLKRARDMRPARFLASNDGFDRRDCDVDPPRI